MGDQLTGELKQDVAFRTFGDVTASVIRLLVLQRSDRKSLNGLALAKLLKKIKTQILVKPQDSNELNWSIAAECRTKQKHRSFATSNIQSGINSEQDKTYKCG